jgi:uncharacterized damage-inducible protein DinB
MLSIFEAYLKCLEVLHTDMRRIIEGLPPEALDWSPGPEMNSLVVLATHVAGSERFWVGEVAGGDPANRNRPAEFQTHGLDEVALLSRLDASLAHTRATLEKLTLPDLEVRRPGMDQDEVTVAWALFHNLQHIGTHLGQMQLTRQLWDLRQNGGTA